jgi:hypothetical protein
MSPEVVPLFGTVPAAGAPIDCPTALRAAETFLAGRLEWFSRLELYRQETVNRGWAPGGYPYDLHQYMWEARHGRCRAWGLGSVHVSVDSVGSLVSFVQYPPTLVAVSLEPTITRDEAIALALARYGEPTTASEAELRIGLSDHGDGSQELYWRVTLTGTKPWCNDSVRLEGASYAFDAHSGKLLWQFVSQNYPESSPDETGEESR